MPSSNAAIFTPAERETLLGLARDSIREGFSGQKLAVRADDYSPALRTPGASFVTLHIDRELRGCIGSLEARAPLAVDVAGNAWNAAFRDPRFGPLSHGEFEQLEIHLSVLSSPEPMQFTSEDDLLGQLRPGVDGLVIEEGYRRGTFLPSVWEQLPEPREFLRYLKRKAGLPADYWSAQLRVSRYTTVSIP
jgi:AmmeMemoRadiSam system protein A